MIDTEVVKQFALDYVIKTRKKAYGDKFNFFYNPLPEHSEWSVKTSAGIVHEVGYDYEAKIRTLVDNINNTLACALKQEHGPVVKYYENNSYATIEQIGTSLRIQIEAAVAVEHKLAGLVASDIVIAELEATKQNLLTTFITKALSKLNMYSLGTLRIKLPATREFLVDSVYEHILDSRKELISLLEDKAKQGCSIEIDNKVDYTVLCRPLDGYMDVCLGVCMTISQPSQAVLFD